MQAEQLLDRFVVVVVAVGQGDASQAPAVVYRLKDAHEVLIEQRARVDYPCRTAPDHPRVGPREREWPGVLGPEPHDVLTRQALGLVLVRAWLRAHGRDVSKRRARCSLAFLA